MYTIRDYVISKIYKIYLRDLRVITTFLWGGKIQTLNFEMWFSPVKNNYVHYLYYLATCQVTTCPSGSTCIDVLPTDCRCKDGFTIKGNTCVSGNILQVKDFKLNSTWNPVYSNKSSARFHIFSLKIENAIFKYLTVELNLTSIIGVQVIGAVPGSITVNFVIIYAENSTTKPATLIQELDKGLNSDSKGKNELFAGLNVINSSLPTVTGKGLFSYTTSYSIKSVFQ